MQLEFIIKFISLVILALVVGYLISSTNYFKTKRLFRISSYILVVIIISSISVLLYKDLYEFNEQIEYKTGPSFFGLMALVHSFLFYIGTRIRTNYREKNRLSLIKKIIAGFLSLAALIGFKNNSNGELIGLCINSTYLIFSWLLIKKYPIIEENISNDEKEIVSKTENKELFSIQYNKDLIINKLKLKKQPVTIENLNPDEKEIVSKVEPETDNMGYSKTLLNTFFFGYLSLKWRRLIRVLILIPLVCWFVFVIVMGGKPSEWILSIAPLPIIGLISWVVKPFTDKSSE